MSENIVITMVLLVLLKEMLVSFVLLKVVMVVCMPVSFVLLQVVMVICRFKLALLVLLVVSFAFL